MRCLAPYPFKEKNEILDFRRIPAGRYELNFRPPSDFPTEDIRKPIAWLWLVAVSATVCIFLLRYFLAPFLDSTTAASVALGIGIILAVTNLLTDWCPRTIAVLFPDRKAAAVILLALPLVVWLLAVVSSRLDVTVGSYLLLALFALPVLLKTADLITTHAVYWMSANPRIDGVDHETMANGMGPAFSRVSSRAAQSEGSFAATIPSHAKGTQPSRPVCSGVLCWSLLRSLPRRSSLSCIVSGATVLRSAP